MFQASYIWTLQFEIILHPPTCILQIVSRVETCISTFIGFMATFYRLCFNYAVLPFAKAVSVVVLDML